MSDAPLTELRDHIAGQDNMNSLISFILAIHEVLSALRQ